MATTTGGLASGAVAVTRGTSVLSELWGLPRYPGAARRRRQRPLEGEGDEEEEEFEYVEEEEEEERYVWCMCCACFDPRSHRSRTAVRRHRPSQCIACLYTTTITTHQTTASSSGQRWRLRQRNGQQ
jgi:hypothetical protein